MDITPQNFGYNTNCVSKKQYDQHVSLYKKYIEKTNQITDLLKNKKNEEDANSIYSVYRGLKESETTSLDAVILHELYFKNMTNVKMMPKEKTMRLIDEYFGNYENWQDDFMACGKAARGWCILSYEQRTKTLRNIMLDAHDKGIVCMAFPIIVLDVYEHAYFLDYATKKNDYIEHFMENIDWETVEQRVLVLENK